MSKFVTFLFIARFCIQILTKYPDFVVPHTIFAFFMITIYASLIIHPSIQMPLDHSSQRNSIDALIHSYDIYASSS